MSASKNGKIAGIVVYKPKVTTSKVTVEVITSKYSEILGSPSYGGVLMLEYPSKLIICNFETLEILFMETLDSD